MADGVVDREAITAAFDALDAALDVVAGLDCDGLTTPEWLGWLHAASGCAGAYRHSSMGRSIAWPAKPRQKSWAASFPARSPSQRQHDGLNAGPRALLTCGELGQHNGLPASIIITTPGQRIVLYAAGGGEQERTQHRVPHAPGPVSALTKPSLHPPTG
ncbi:MAG TPA: DUF222 domain-containing protein [Mycobacterium sp.]|nr:DUF222 domain-containing protein [Mycobacterium sp.]HTX98177.1 DUF222 domain-containing protein [Mycobacterium sp.]